MPRTPRRDSSNPDPAPDSAGGYPNDPDYQEGREPGPVYGVEPNRTPADIHADYVRRRLEGGAPPTAAAYARAIRQWRLLPGAVSGSAADLGELPPERPPGQDESQPDTGYEPESEPKSSRGGEAS